MYQNDCLYIFRTVSEKVKRNVWDVQPEWPTWQDGPSHNLVSPSAQMNFSQCLWVIREYSLVIHRPTTSHTASHAVLQLLTLQVPVAWISEYLLQCSRSLGRNHCHWASQGETHTECDHVTWPANFHRTHAYVPKVYNKMHCCCGNSWAWMHEDLKK